ncbi:murein biosynthesis integral membrane protein MurJ [Streptomyces beijiangensis]|uniref:Murein biosynthesis protein MurJ n=1 Tax=Streptomyces beijiangensis TaxID=163361 RepID=A0A939F8N4_9ACTN|nr:lipid II flippase MurJ [Streptomyces beijiangensis]MBO0514420.1 murein biosynthesis protein MurJ [Streptomyces beijiangensis]
MADIHSPVPGTRRPLARYRKGGRGPEADELPGGRGVLARAALLTAVLTAAGAVLGLARDQTLAHLFGAGSETDAFLVAWTVPEFASTLLIEDAMALLLVPAFSRALALRAGDASLRTDPVRHLLRTTLPRLALATGAVAALVVLAAPALVSVLAPGLREPHLAIDCTRLTATCVFTFALAGYFSAALRAHGCYISPAMIYVAYNVGIIGTLLVTEGAGWGVRSAAAGVAIGGVLMVAVQAPSLWRVLRVAPGSTGPVRTAAPEAGSTLALALMIPVVVFTVSRQSQVLVERFLASPLPGGAISHLNYAQKVAQIPMVLSLMLCTVNFPVVARALAAGRPRDAQRRMERDLIAAAAIVLVGTAVVIAAAPQIVELLFQRGAFDAEDTRATATIMRVYALGLLGQTLVGTLVRCYFSAARPLWYPAAAMLAGLAVNIFFGLATAALWGATGIAAANALGITVTAALLLCGIRRQGIPLATGRLSAGLCKLTAAAAVATAAGWFAARTPLGPFASVALTAVVAAVSFLAVAVLVRAPEITSLLASVSRRLVHADEEPPLGQNSLPGAQRSAVDRDVPLDQ